MKEHFCLENELPAVCKHFDSSVKLERERKVINKNLSKKTT